MLNYQTLLDNFLEKTTNIDPFVDYFNESNVYQSDTNKDLFIQKTNNPEIVLNKKKDSVIFIPITRKNLGVLFDAYKIEVQEVCDFLLKETQSTEQLLMIETSEQKEALFISLSNPYNPDKSISKIFKFKKKFPDFEELNKSSVYLMRYCEPFIKFFIFAKEAILLEAINNLKEKVSELKEESNSKTLLHKMPINIVNVMLTNKSSTIEKLDRKIEEIELTIAKTQNQKKLTRLHKQKELARELVKKAKVNFPDDFYFTVYEHYAIFGGMKLLHQNNFQPTPFTATAILEVLGFENINNSEITEIRKAFAKLTTNKFPCYYIRQDRKDPEAFRFSNADTPIYMIYEDGKVNLNVNITDDDIIKKKLYLCLLNVALVEDLQHFFTMIEGNLLANLRDKKKVTEDDLYFIEFLIREKQLQFHKQTKTDLNKICKIMKKDEWLENGGLSRENKRQIKNKTKTILDFAVAQPFFVSDYTIDRKGDIVINYNTAKKNQFLTNKEIVLLT